MCVAWSSNLALGDFLNKPFQKPPFPSFHHALALALALIASF
jgi:hypothetical protein